MRETLRQQSALFRSLELGTDASAWSREVGFADGETVFTEGSAGDACYVVISGTAAVYRQEGGRPTLVAAACGSPTTLGT